MGKTINNTDIRKIIFSPADERKLFIITKRNGLWVSWNAGHNWDPIMSNADIADMVIDARDTKILYAAVKGSIAKSEDEGVSWKGIYTSDRSSVSITSLVIDPNDPRRILAATSDAQLLLSENNGIAWRVLAQTPSELLHMEYHPSRTGVLYAGSAREGLVRSIDNGETWETFADAFSEYAGAKEYRDFVLIPSGVVYASAFGLLRSLNHGAHWAPLPLISGKKGSNIQTLGIDPTNPQHIYYGTAATFYISLDGGLNWIPRSIPSTRSASDIVINPMNPKELYLGVSR